MARTVDISQFFTKRQSNSRFVLRSELLSGDLELPIIHGRNIVPEPLPANRISPLTIGEGQIADGALAVRRLYEGSRIYVPALNFLPPIPNTDYPIGSEVFLEGTGNYFIFGDPKPYPRGRRYVSRVVNGIEKWVSTIDNLPAAISLENFSSSIRPASLGSSLPNLAIADNLALFPKGSQFYHTTQNRPYESSGQAPSSLFSSWPAGEIKDAAQLGWDPVVRFLSLAGKLAADQIENGILDHTKFAAGIRAVALVNSLPAIDGGPTSLETWPIGSPLFLLEADGANPANALYRRVGNQWRRTGAQDREADSVVAGAIAAGAVNTRELAAGSIRAEKLAIGNFSNLAGGGVNVKTVSNSDRVHSSESWTRFGMTQAI